MGFDPSSHPPGGSVRVLSRLLQQGSKRHTASCLHRSQMLQGVDASSLSITLKPPAAAAGAHAMIYEEEEPPAAEAAILNPTFAVTLREKGQHLRPGTARAAADVSVKGGGGDGQENAKSKSSSDRVTAADITSEPIMHVAMEYTLPHLGLNSEFCYGGLGKVCAHHVWE